MSMCEPKMALTGHAFRATSDKRVHVPVQMYVMICTVLVLLLPVGVYSFALMFYCGQMNRHCSPCSVLYVSVCG